jgi:Plasmid pRiA4b ORF-3-like protein
MKKPISPKSAPESLEKTYQLKIELEGVSPPVWRQLQVPGDATLGWLHAAIQLAMGWTNSHLHQFIICDRIFSDPLFEMNELDDDPPVLDEHKVRLKDVAPHMRSVFMYQ